MNKMNVADKLGAVQASIRELREVEKELKEEILKAGGMEGDLFKYTVVEQDRTVVDWKAIANYLCPSHQLVRAHTEYKHVSSVRGTARPTASLKLVS